MATIGKVVAVIIIALIVGVSWLCSERDKADSPVPPATPKRPSIEYTIPPTLKVRANWLNITLTNCCPVGSPQWPKQYYGREATITGTVKAKFGGHTQIDSVICKGFTTKTKVGEPITVIGVISHNENRHTYIDRCSEEVP